MAKRLPMTDQLRARIAQAAGADVNPDQLVAFETIALNTLPLNKRGSLFHKGRIDAALLAEMAPVPAQGGVPLHNLHQQGMELPVGKTFFSEVVQNDSGQLELRAQFYLPIGQTDLIEKLDTGVIDEVSVGVRSKKIVCSACDFDYAAPDAPLMCILDQTCPKEHTIGKDGNHVVLKGLDRWLELSLVSLGAADRPKIVGRTKALLGADAYNQLAAAGVSPDATTLFATAVKEDPMNVDVNKLIADIATETSKAALLTANVATLTASNTQLTTDLATARAKIVELEAAAGEPGKLLTAEQAKTAALTAEVDATKAFLTEQLKAATVAATGKPLEDKDVPKDVAGLTAALKATTDSIHKLFPVGGVSNALKAGEGNQNTVDHSAFKVGK